MKNYLFQIKDHFDAASVEKELQEKGLENTYHIEEKDKTLIGGFSLKRIVTENALLIEEKHSISWEDQWALFAKDFTEGLAHIDLTPFGAQKTLLLKPGPGFGDLSHPTTHLMLQMMKGRLQNQSVVDIGSGSGILTLSALLLEASFGRGIDIDPKALVHARQNSKLNKLSTKVIFSKKLPKKLPSHQIFLMNMLPSEQEAFDPSRWNFCASIWIVSGILKSQQNDYLKLARKWGWDPIEKCERGEWTGWVFRPRN